MASTLIGVGLGLAAVGYVARYASRMKLSEKFVVESLVGSKYYKGGFEPRMSKREAALILGLSPTASKLKIKEAHKRIMIANHPDRGGSPYLAAKINEAKDLFDGRK